MDFNAHLSDLLKKLGMDSTVVDAVMQQQPDLNDLLQEAEAQGMTDAAENPALAQIMGQMNSAVEQIIGQGGLSFMPGNLDGMLEQFGGMEGIQERLAEISGVDFACEEIDLEAEVAAYAPAAEDAADRKFLAALKEWLRTSITEIPDKDVCAFEIGYHAGFEGESLEHVAYEIWLAYNTDRTNAENREVYGEETWNWINWTDDQFRILEDTEFAAWRAAQGFDEDNDGEDMIRRIYDLAAVAVMELHKERFTEQRFGRKIPFVIEDYEYCPFTAVRAVKANGGTELFDAQFFAECGVAFEAEQKDGSDDTADL